ncbi:MAG: phage holin family protein [Nocardioides sp.]
MSLTTMRFRVGDLVRLVVVWVICAFALQVTAWVLPNLSAPTFGAWLAATAIAAVAGLFVRPVLVAVSARIGWVMVILTGLLGQALVVYLSFQLVSGIQSTFTSAFISAWVVALVSLLLSFLLTAGNDDAYAAKLARRHKPAKIDDPDVDGVIFVQIDGVPFPVLRWAIQSGAVATVRRWVTSGDYVLHEWTPQLPCTTPASQLGILHGTIDRIPAFRWYDRELGRLLVANRPADAAVIEERASDGLGLLADGGLSLSNLFTGDAPRSLMTMSRVTLSRGSGRSRSTVARYVNDPEGFARGLLRAIGEIAKERFQARRQVRRDLVPRTHRGWDFAGLRAATNVLTRDLNTSVIAEELAAGTRSVYVDYVDYDEIAHHAGIFRPESLASLDGLDRVLATLQKLAERAPRKYHIVVVSDHGQSQGEPFASAYGIDLGTLCSQLMAEKVDTVQADVEGWGRAGAMAGDAAAGGGLSGRVAAKAAARAADEVDESVAVTDADISVIGSGNLGLLYVHGPERLLLETIEERWPRLVPGLVDHAGVGFVAAMDAEGHRIVIGAQGRHDLDTGVVTGTDPLAPFPEHAAEVLARAMALKEAPDLYLNSTLDPDTLDIAAFEPLVGAHGGLGGWQDRAVLLVPRDLEHVVPAERILGADRLHEVLVKMLEEAGQRTDERFRRPAVTG